TTATSVAMIATCRDRAKRSLISSQIGDPVHIEVPKSRRATPTIHVANCFQTGWSRPKRTRSASIAAWEADPRSPANRSSTTSPGITRMRKKVTTATPTRVGNISRKRLNRYFHMCRWPGRAGSSSGPAPRPRLLGQPDRVELVVQVVAGRDRPAFHLRAVRDDPVPLERPDDVRLLVEKPLLQLPHQLLAVLHVDGPGLLLVQLVDHLILVLAVVGVRRGDEAHQVQVRLHDEAALEVHRDLEVAALQHRMIGGGLDGLDLHVEPDLPPLVDEPDRDRLVGMRNPAVLEREREAVGHARLAQEPLGLGPVGVDVVPV